MSKTKHPYAQVLRWIADGEEIETCDLRGLFFGTHPKEVLSKIYDEQPFERFRLKPRTININGHEVPEPMRESPAKGTSYYAPDINDPNNQSLGFLWSDSMFDRHRLNSRLCHYPQEAAEAHARALLSFNKGQD